MNIKGLLIGSAAALTTISGAQAADAIVAAEPEPLEYVRVCDAFGEGFFYIPGTETCLKFGGYVRFQTDFGRDESGTSDWNSFTRAQFEVDTKTDTELGALRGFIGFRGNAENGSAASSSVFVDQAFISLGGLTVGKVYSEWDNDLNGETDILSTNTLFNSIRYTYDAGSFSATLS
ncbi:porin, partial [Agrobacterium rosae]